MPAHSDLLHAQSVLDSCGQSPSRRLALKTATMALGVGYTSASGPVQAQTAIRTSAEGLEVGEVMVEVAGIKMPVYRAAPVGRTNMPVVLVISEVFGVHEYIADTARRLARAGYMALAPELFVRQGEPMQYNAVADLMREVVSKVPDGQVMADLDALTQWAASHGGDIRRLAITGFCWGGRITWLYAAHNPAVKAGVAWYGRLVGQASDLQPKHPVDVAAKLHAPVLGLYAGADQGIGLDTVERMKGVLASGSAAAKQSEFVVYEGAPHAFHADYRPTYRQEAAQDGWKRCLAWLKSQGVA